MGGATGSPALARLAAIIGQLRRSDTLLAKGHPL